MINFETFFRYKRPDVKATFIKRLDILASVVSKPPFNFTWKQPTSLELDNLREDAIVYMGTRTVAPNAINFNEYKKVHPALNIYSALQPSDHTEPEIFIEYPYVDYFIDREDLRLPLFIPSRWTLILNDDFQSQISELDHPGRVPNMNFEALEYWQSIAGSKEKKDISTIEYIWEVSKDTENVQPIDKSFIDRLKKKYLPPDEWSDADLVGQL